MIISRRDEFATQKDGNAVFHGFRLFDLKNRLKSFPAFSSAAPKETQGLPEPAVMS